MTRTSLMLALLMAPLAANAGDPLTGPLSLAHAVSLASQANPSLVTAQLSLDQAEASVSRAAGVWDPTLTLGASTQYSQSQSFLAGSPLDTTNRGWGPTAKVTGLLPTGTQWSVSTSLNQSVSASSGVITNGEVIEQNYWNGAATATVTQDLLALARPTSDRVARRVAYERLDQATLTAVRAEQAAIVDVASAWWDWTTAHEPRGVAESAVEEAASLLTLTRTRAEVGLVDDVEVARVEAEVLQARIDALNADARVRSSTDTLLVRLGVDPGADIVPGDSTVIAPVTGDVAEHVELALSVNPDIRLARAQADAADAALRDARLSRLPDLSLAVSAGVGSLQSSAAAATSALFSDKAFPNASASLLLTVPLGNRVAVGDQRVAEGVAASADAAVADLERQTAARVRAAVDAVDTARQGQELAEARLDVARRTEDGERARADAGTRRLDELLSATRVRQSAEVAVLTARQAVAIATLDLALLEGRVDAGLWGAL